MSEIKKDGVDSQLEKLYDEIEKKHEKEVKRAKSETQMNEILNGLENPSKSNREGNELLRFFGGLLLFGAGMYMILQNLSVTSAMGSTGGSLFHMGSLYLPNGTIMIPILIGIALLFLCDRKLWGWLFIAVGVVIVIAAVIMSVSIHWKTSSAWVFLVMFGMTFAGGAMMMRELFRSK